MAIEEWKTIPNFYDYEVSNLGRVRSKDRIVSQRNSKFKTGIQHRKFKSKILNQFINSHKGKYPHYYLTLRKDRKSFKWLVHRLVLVSFVGDCPAGMQCCHNDGNGLNNNLNNLRWDTPSNNQLDRLKHGTDWVPVMKGEHHPCAKLTNEDILFIRSVKPYKNRAKDIALKYGISKSSVHQIIAGRSWKHVKGRYRTN